ncbi:MAG TPA: hypothetical protein VKZ53_10425 [Candidatus Angelobacter sp.]|nr:hypothetical protein [Candidatus Angelobacter sp.]
MEESQEQNPRSNSILTDEKKKLQRERDGLLLSRSNVLQRIELCSNPTYKASLQQALGELDKKISDLG